MGLSRWVVVRVGVFELRVVVGMGMADSCHQSQSTGPRSGLLPPRVRVPLARASCMRYLHDCEGIRPVSGGAA
jgi:hypothetical protein